MPSNSARGRRSPAGENLATRRVAMVVFPGVTLLDISGPAQVFAELREIDLSGASYSLSYLSSAGGSVPTDVGMMIDTAPISAVRPHQVDTLVIPGGPGVWVLRQDASLMNWISQTVLRARRVASVCLGAFVLAWAGVLHGKRAATHWRYCPRLQDNFPEIRVEPDAIFVRDGRVWSSAGVSAGIDLALAMIEEDFGHTVALDVARRLVVFLKRPGGQSQFSTVLAAQASDVEGRFSALHAWILENIASDLKVEKLAEMAGMTPRTFARTYVSRTGMTPASGVEALRVETARLLLESRQVGGVVEVAKRAGFGDDERMRRAFIRHLGVSPSEYRKRFSR
ncbi:GlxA family transcriptional regulator [Bradyrhizobium sp.]|uniref:GlxA family transcriptional regulator n=1 Tax=Bradyrhizobium sp. TaxID=376 RepID=UPI001D3621D2|nr:DJ-1/PfpI family protein [Bradyrhizobium sp.]MBV8701098.1 DJ-1/PfpI family protein [Bradyrhizobium sp.]MBV8918372.1 DJ-1/PfpI family protein [Bradyrhizobium sp.]